VKNFLIGTFVFATLIFGSIDFDANASVDPKEIPIRIEPEGVEDIVEQESAEWTRQIALMEKYKVNLGAKTIDEVFFNNLEGAARDMMAYCQDGDPKDCNALASFFLGRSKRYVDPDMACQAARIYGYSCEFYKDKKSCRSFNLLKKHCEGEFK
jgi:hypothetical protein